MSEPLTESLEDVNRWCSVFEHGWHVDDMVRFLTVPSSIQELQDALESSRRWTNRDGRWFPSHAELSNHAHRITLAEEHLRECLGVISFLAKSHAIVALGISGSVAAGVNEETGDVDLILIARAGHVWRARALAIHLEHHAPGGHRICPNMVLDERELRLRPSRYAARELAMVRPVSGIHTFNLLWEANPWATEYLPNASIRPSISYENVEESCRAPWWWRWMRTPGLGRIIERWEASRRIRVLSRTSTSDEATYSRTRCIGHEHGHRARIEASMAELQATRGLEG